MKIFCIQNAIETYFILISMLAECAPDPVSVALGMASSGSSSFSAITSKTLTLNFLLCLLRESHDGDDPALKHKTSLANFADLSSLHFLKAGSFIHVCVDLRIILCTCRYCLLSCRRWVSVTAMRMSVVVSTTGPSYTIIRS